MNMASFQAISHLDIAGMIPPGGKMSFKEIAEKTGLNKDMIARLLRHAITMRVFREPQIGMVAHTKNSKALTDPSINNWLKVASGTIGPSAAKV
jgi:hypothetical protein